MGLANFIMTVVAVDDVVVLARSDVKQSASIFHRYVRHIRNRLKEESIVASQYAFFDVNIDGGKAKQVFGSVV
ncbi:Beta-galactosidase 11 [Bienertia sinuspersici]